MSRRASRSSFSGSDQSELVLECKAAYLSIFNSIDEKIRRKDDLIEVLQQTGRNPSSNAIKKHWSSKTDYLTFDDFVDICRKEPETTEDDMMKAFCKIDINGDGYLSLDELYKIMSTKGEKMTRDEVKKMIDEVDENGDGRLDYKESIVRDDRVLYKKFCQMVAATTKECKKASLKIMEKKERKKKKEQKNYAETSLRKEEPNLGSQISVKSSSSFRSSSAKMGSQQSLQSREETSEKKTGSMISVRSDSANKKDDSKESDKESEHSDGGKSDGNDDDDDENKGSKSQKRKNKKSDDDMGSTATLKSETMGSRVSLKSASKLSPRRQSQTSLASQSASRISLKGEKKQESDKDSEHSDGGKSDGNDDGDDEKKGNKSRKRKQKNKKSDEEMGSTATLKSETMGSRVSLKSASKLSSRRQSQTSVASQSASRISLKGEEKKESDKDSEHSDGGKSADNNDKDGEKKESKSQKRKRKNKKSDEDMGSTTTLKSENMGSRVSLKSETMGSTVSLKSASKLSSRRQSQTSVASQSASRISLKGEDKSESVSGSRTSLVSAGMSGSRRSMLSIGDKELITPVPTQRKSLARSQLLEDDLPRPSPRSKKDRPRGGAAAKLDRLPEPRNLKSWTHKSIKGCFFLEDDSIVNHHYELTLEDDSEIWITIQPISTKSIASEDTVVDTALYIVRKDARDDGSYIAFTELRDSKGKYGKKCKLDAGDYCIYPMTTGCHLKPRTREPKREVDIIKKDKDDNVVLTKAFKKALDDIFEMCDLDDNGSISREEFGWFNKRTSDETVTDEEWQVVEEKIDLNNDREITRQGFIQLHQMEAEDEGDPEDLWLTMTNFGFNKELVMDEACPFKIDVYADECEGIEIKVSDIENISDKLAPLLQQSAIDKGECTKIKGMKDLFLYTYINDGRATIVVDNKSYSKVKVDVDCSSSKNCLSNTGSLHNSITVRANTQEIGLHLVPADESYDWTVRCSESILK